MKQCLSHIALDYQYPLNSSCHWLYLSPIYNLMTASIPIVLHTNPIYQSEPVLMLCPPSLDSPLSQFLPGCLSVCLPVRLSVPGVVCWCASLNFFPEPLSFRDYACQSNVDLCFPSSLIFSSLSEICSPCFVSSTTDIPMIRFYNLLRLSV